MKMYMYKNLEHERKCKEKGWHTSVDNRKYRFWGSLGTLKTYFKQRRLYQIYSTDVMEEKILSNNDKLKDFEITEYDLDKMSKRVFFLKLYGNNTWGER